MRAWLVVFDPVAEGFTHEACGGHHFPRPVRVVGFVSPLPAAARASHVVQLGGDMVQDHVRLAGRPPGQAQVADGMDAVLVGAVKVSG